MDSKEYFDEIADEWEKNHRDSGDIDSLKSLVDIFPFADDDVILDAGCGTGRLVPFLQKAIGRKGILFEMDYSAEMLKIGKKKYSGNSLYFVQSDAQELPFQEKRFDAVICLALFPHICDKAAALNEFRRVLKPGKPLIVAHLMSRNELNVFHAQVHGPVKHDMLPDESIMRGLFDSAGFKELTIRDEPSLYLAQAKA